MFTGLVQDIGTIRDLSQQNGELRAVIETNMNLAPVHLGASICCSGCCLTVVDKSKNTFSVDISKETQDKTIFRSLGVMARINIEPSLKVGDELGGHLVSGHIDARSEILEIKEEGGSHIMTFLIPKGLEKLVAAKGSITLDGVSLTVNTVDNDTLSVNIIPHTWEHTTLSDRKPGDFVNMEVDMLARYVARALQV